MALLAGGFGAMAHQHLGMLSLSELSRISVQIMGTHRH